MSLLLATVLCSRVKRPEDIFINRQGAMLTDGSGEGRIWPMNSEITKIVND